MDDINRRRRDIFKIYHYGLSPLADAGLLQLSNLALNSESNSHLFYILLKDENTRNNLMDFLKKKNILSVFHYVPLHLSPVGLAMGYVKGNLPITESISGRLLRLPFYFELEEKEQREVIKAIENFFSDGK
jgi:dTDP-4-amino-4,6-dideoxygalactose transaminase